MEFSQNPTDQDTYLKLCAKFVIWWCCFTNVSW